jgi:hypothetical protein
MLGFTILLAGGNAVAGDGRKVSGSTSVKAKRLELPVARSDRSLLETGVCKFSAAMLLQTIQQLNKVTINDEHTPWPDMASLF